MNTSQVRDLVRSYLTQYGVTNVGRIPITIIDNLINVEMQSHFSKVKSLHGYWHTLTQENMDEYELPTECLSISLVKLSNERYYPAKHPYIDEAKSALTSNRTVTDEGYTVSGMRDRFFWVKGRTLCIYPPPVADTGTKTSGDCTCTTAGIVTVSSGSLGSVNACKGLLCLLGSVNYLILSNSATAFVVDGTPAGTEVTYTIYNHGIQIEGLRYPTAITVGGDDNIPGTDIDANCIAIKVSVDVAMTLPNAKNINMQGLVALYSEFLDRSKHDLLNTYVAPTVITPWNLRTDKAGNR